MSVRSGTGRHFFAWRKKREGIALPYRKQHAVRFYALDGARLKISDVRKLTPHQLFRSRIGCDSGNYSARTFRFSEINAAFDELVGFRHALRRAYGTDAYLYLAEILY